MNYGFSKNVEKFFKLVEADEKNLSRIIVYFL